MSELIRLIEEDAARVVDAVDLGPLDGRSVLITAEALPPRDERRTA